MLRRIALAAIALFALLAVGCYSKATAADGTVTFRYDWWVVCMAAGFGLVGVVVGGWLCTLRNTPGARSIIGGVAFVIVGSLLLVGLVPSLAMEKVEVTDTHFAGAHGLWFAQSTYDVQYADVSQMTVHKTVTRKRRVGRPGRGRRVTSYTLEMTGRIEHDDINMDNLFRYAAPEIFRHAKGKGISVAGEALTK